MNSTLTHDFYPATTANAPLNTFDDQDTITLQCVFAGRTQKGMWLTCPDGKTRLFAISLAHIMTGEQRQGASITIQVKGWVYKQAFIKGEQQRTTQAALPAPVATTTQPIGADEITITMNKRMLKRLIWLCDPAKHHGEAVQHAVIAKGFLSDVAGGLQ